MDHLERRQCGAETHHDRLSDEGFANRRRMDPDQLAVGTALGCPANPLPHRIAPASDTLAEPAGTERQPMYDSGDQTIGL